MWAHFKCLVSLSILYDDDDDDKFIGRPRIICFPLYFSHTFKFSTVKLYYIFRRKLSTLSKTNINARKLCALDAYKILA